MPDRSEIKAGAKSEETRQRICTAALALFHEQGFEAATMRDIARSAGVATGAAYYYFPSKDAIIMDFYRRSCVEMQPKIEDALKNATGLDRRLRELIGVKLAHFAPHRGVLRALLRNGADPQTSALTLQSTDSGDPGHRYRLVSRYPRRMRSANTKGLEPHLPGVLWFLQMGVIFFWVIDDSPNRRRVFGYWVWPRNRLRF